MRRLRRFLIGAATIFAGLIALAVVAAWITQPKLFETTFLARAPGPGVFTFDDIPRGGVLTDAQVDGYASRLLGEMSLAEKVHQMSGDSWYLDLVPLVVTKKYNDTAIPTGENRRLHVPPILFSDGPGGVVMRHSTSFPVAIARAASWDRALMHRVGDAIGEEVRAGGANFYGGVCINLLRHPGWGRAQETFGEDPYVLGEMAAEMADAVQHHNVIACVKHFALNSVEEDRHTIDARADERTLREVYLPHFKRAVDAGAWAVMSSYNRVNGDYSAENRWLLTDVLRRDWGFRGIVMSDFFQGVYDARKGALAGLDIEMPIPRVFGTTLISLVESGEVPVSVVNAAARRILAAKIRWFTRPDPERYDASLVVSPAHVALAEEVAEQSLVLLKNEHDALPLVRGTLRRVAVVGRLAAVANLGDHGSSRVYPPSTVSPLAGLKEAAGAGVEILAGATTPVSAAEMARHADAAIVVAGLDYHDEGEYIPEMGVGGDRRSLGLHREDLELIDAVASVNARTIIVVEGGSAITMEEWRGKVPAILMAFYPGMEGGRAIARLLFGDVNPSGKLPLTIPADAAWLPPFTPGAPHIEYGCYHGYTLADKRGIVPAYPFGFGLSYTRFTYSNLRLASPVVAPAGVLEASVDVTNAGTRPGREVVQLYVGFPHSAVDRPVKLLRGFEKVLLAPGETRTVRFTVPVSSLAYWDVARKGWTVEPVDYAVYAGPSSRADQLVVGSFRVSPPS